MHPAFPIIKGIFHQFFGSLFHDELVERSDFIQVFARANPNIESGLALGPYVIGQMSDVFHSNGMVEAEALRLAMACSMFIFVITITCLVIAMRYLPGDEATRLERARALGEPV